ncbi:PH domain-containing protein [Parapontixanthobacter aurantiacus]
MIGPDEEARPDPLAGGDQARVIKLDGTAPSRAATIANDGEEQRTDPKGFIASGASLSSNMLLPLLALGYTFSSDGISIPFILSMFGIFLCAAMALAYLSWRRLTYRVGETDIRVTSGILSRQARSVPYERIQDVSVEQSLVPRLLGLVAIKFETGAGGKDELALAYLGEAEGERLRELVRERRDGQATAALASADGDAEAVPGDAGEVIFAMDRRRVLTFGFFEFSLAVVAAAFAAVQQFDFALPFDIYDFDAWQDLLAGPGAALYGMGAMAQVVGGIVAVLSLVLIGLVTGLVRTVLREWDFTLLRTPKGFRRRRGLLTRTDVVMPVHRVQALKIATGVIRRRFGWHSLKLVSLAQDSGGASHDAAPFARMEEIEPIVRAAGFDPVPAATEWRRGSLNHAKDAAFVTALLLLSIAGAIAVFLLFGGQDIARGYWLVPFGLLCLSGVLAAWEILGWSKRLNALDDHQLYFRRGILAGKTDIADRAKLQSVEISRGPIAQRRGYATLKLGLAGGSFVLEGLPVERAHELREALLESMTRSDFSVVVAA